MLLLESVWNIQKWKTHALQMKMITIIKEVFITEVPCVYQQAWTRSALSPPDDWK